MSFYNEHTKKEQRNHMLKRVVDSLDKGTPEDVIKRYIVNEYKYSLSGAGVIVREAKMLQVPKEKKRRPEREL